MIFDDFERLALLGLNVGRYGQLSHFEKDAEHPRSHEIAEACSFLGADGILVLSARDAASRNLIVFCEQATSIVEIVRAHGVVTFAR